MEIEILKPQVIVIAGPNGAGKSTFASRYLPKSLVYANADEIAKELTAPLSQHRDFQAGRIMQQKLDELEERKEDFALETTLAGRSLAHRIARLRNLGYHATLFFLWLPSVELSIERVAERVRRGGHHIPEPTIRRRFQAGIRNFFQLYRPLADAWTVYENSQLGKPEAVAEGRATEHIQVFDAKRWHRIQEGSSDE